MAAYVALSSTTCHISISLDGFAAGPNQSLDEPIGEGGEGLHKWMFESDSDIDARRRAQIVEGNGAYIMGRNMFGPPDGGEWDESWKGWWGDDPPYHAPVFVLTHYPREPVPMEGGTTFHFVTGGMLAALERARAVAGDKDIRVGGGVSVVRQFLQARLLDELQLVLPPVALGAGESLFAGLDLPALGYAVVSRVASPHATHVTFARKS